MLILETSLNYTIVSPPRYPASHTDSISFFPPQIRLSSILLKQKSDNCPVIHGLCWRISGSDCLLKNFDPILPMFTSHSSLHPKVTNPNIPKSLGFLWYKSHCFLSSPAVCSGLSWATKLVTFLSLSLSPVLRKASLLVLPSVL